MLIDYRFWFHPSIELCLREVVERYNGEHEEPANTAWMSKGDWTLASQNGLGGELGLERMIPDPCIRVAGNARVGRVCEIA